MAVGVLCGLPLISNEQVLAGCPLTVYYSPQGDMFERSSLLAGLLSASLLIGKPNPLAILQDKYSCFRSLRNFPDVATIDAENCFVSDGVSGRVCGANGGG